MSLPQTPPETEIPPERDPSIDPPGPPLPEDEPIDEPGIQLPGSDEPPVTIPREEPGVSV